MLRSKPFTFCSDYLAFGEVSTKVVRQKLIVNLGTKSRTLKTPM